MHPTQIAKPFHREGWVYEEKVDGRRMVAIKGKHGVPGEPALGLTIPQSLLLRADQVIE